MLYLVTNLSVRRAEIARTGKDPGEAIAFDLTSASETDRAVIARNTTTQMSGIINTHGNNRDVIYVQAPADCVNASPAEVAAALLRKEAREEAERVRRELEKQKCTRANILEVEKALEEKEWIATTERLRLEDIGTVEVEYSRPALPFLTPAAEEARPDLTERVALIHTERLRLQTAAKEELAAKIAAMRADNEKRKQEERAAKEAQDKARKDAMLAWIEERGSERLRICARREIPCDAIYRDERDAFEGIGENAEPKSNDKRDVWVRDIYDISDLLPGSSFVCGNWCDPRNPPLTALQALEANPGSKLGYVATYRNDPDDENADVDGDVRDGGIYVLAKPCWDGTLIYSLAAVSETADAE